MKTSLMENESVIKEGKANRQRNVESAGGKLYLTNQRLVFEGHGFNSQGTSISIDFKDCMFVTKGWTKFLGLIPLFPNAIVLSMKDGKSHRFSVFGRKKWVAKATECLCAV